MRAGLQDGSLKTPEPVPDWVKECLEQSFHQLDSLTVQIQACQAEMVMIAKQHKVSIRAMTVPGVGPTIAFALLAFAGDLTQFRDGREFATWIRLTPRESSTGGRKHFGGITKMG